MPPHVPAPLPQFQTFSDCQAPPGPVVDNVVPPTCMMYGLSAGKGIGPVNASESPQALKKDWPCAAICRKIWSPAGSGGPPAPGATELLGEVIIGHATEQIDPRTRIGRFIDVDARYGRRQRHHHLDVQANLTIITAGSSDTPRSDERR